MVHRWHHYRVLSVLETSTVAGLSVDMPFVRCFEERAYQQRLFELLEAHCQDSLTVSSTFPIHNVSLDLIMLDYTLNILPFIAKPAFWEGYSC